MPKNKDGKPVPFRRASRVAGLGGMAAKVAGGMAAKGARDVLSGKRPSLESLLLTPANAKRVTDQLSNMRGAAMKIGQMMSMESGDFLPREFADILAKLRAEAQHMPRAQLESVLEAEWGPDWIDKFSEFSDRPIAAASIGQVHKATLPGGQTLAIKIQYPGVRESIDSDVSNVSALINMTGLVPKNLDVAPIIEEARQQLHQEADYQREAQFLVRFGNLLRGDDRFAVPDYFAHLSTDRVLAMSYLDGTPVEDLDDAPQDVRDRVVIRLMDLVMRELFEFGVMQTDPNFANYQYDPDTDKIILLDFGASREISETVADNYRNLMQACLSGEPGAVFQAMIQAGFVAENLPGTFLMEILDIIQTVIEPVSQDIIYDFGQSEVVQNIRDRAIALSKNREVWHLPPPETIFIQRKIGGVYLLASRLRAQVNIHALMRNYLG